MSLHIWSWHKAVKAELNSVHTFRCLCRVVLLFSKTDFSVFYNPHIITTNPTKFFPWLMYFLLCFEFGIPPSSFSEICLRCLIGKSLYSPWLSHKKISIPFWLFLPAWNLCGPWIFALQSLKKITPFLLKNTWQSFYLLSASWYLKKIPLVN